MIFLNFLLFFIWLILINLTSQMIVVPYWIRIFESFSVFEYNGKCYKSMQEMIMKIIRHKQITNIKQVCVYNMGFYKRNAVTRTKIKICESALPFIDPRYKSHAIDLAKVNNYDENVYRCGKKISKSLEYILKISFISRCHIKVNIPVQLVTHKPWVHKPTAPPKPFCIYTIYGMLCYNKRNRGFEHVWKGVWSYCIGKCYYYDNFKSTKKKYFTELNRYRRVCGNPPLIWSPYLARKAQDRTSVMTHYKELVVDRSKNFDELIASSQKSHGIFLMKILFDDAWLHNSNINRKSAKKREMARLLSDNQRYVGIGIAKKGETVYVCIKFSPRSIYEE